MRRITLTATRLRLILSISLVSMVLFNTTIYYLSRNELRKVGDTVSLTKGQANASQNNLQTLQQIGGVLQANESAIKDASRIVADSQEYGYQDQIINDLNRYASRAGISITNVEFADAASATPAAPSSTTQTPSTTVVPAGLKTSTITVTIKNPVRYKSLLKFMRSVEQNLTKMQIASINLTQGEDGVTTDVITLEVFVR